MIHFTKKFITLVLALTVAAGTFAFSAQASQSMEPLSVQLLSVTPTVEFSFDKEAYPVGGTASMDIILKDFPACNLTALEIHVAYDPAKLQYTETAAKAINPFSGPFAGLYGPGTPGGCTWHDPLDATANGTDEGDIVITFSGDGNTVVPSDGESDIMVATIEFTVLATEGNIAVAGPELFAPCLAKLEDSYDVTEIACALVPATTEVEGEVEFATALGAPAQSGNTVSGHVIVERVDNALSKLVDAVCIVAAFDSQSGKLYGAPQIIYVEDSVAEQSVPHDYTLTLDETPAGAVSVRAYLLEGWTTLAPWTSVAE
ncbi:MAG: hypothetical protein E7409_00535 [Ruminococcaceae bacterium]|nr:hypothetical protein [Oscillospiraceae bacterium]